MILDLTLVGEMAGIVTAVMQSIKSHPKIKGSLIPYLSGVVGAGIGVGWYTVTGEIKQSGSLLGIDWADGFRGLFNGVAGAVTANGAFNLQKFLPFPNILPTSGEMDDHKLEEEVKAQERAVEAVTQGLSAETAKEISGTEVSTEVLETVATPPEEAVQEMKEEIVG